jgi:hypothetical protein
MRTILLAVFFILAICFTAPSASAKIPNFVFVDLELFSTTLSGTYAMHSGLFVDVLVNPVYLHFGMAGAYLGVNFVYFETGLSWILSGIYIPDYSVWRMFQLRRRGMDDDSSGFWRPYKTEVVVSHSIEIYLRGFLNSYANDRSPDGTTIVFAKSYPNISQAEYYVYDKIISLGYQYRVVIRDFGTVNDILFSARGLLGFRDRRADLWNFTTSTTPAYSPTQTGIGLGAEAEFRIFFGQFRMGFYDGIFYFNAGIRIPFSFWF